MTLQTATRKNKVCCITGGARGIGAACVNAFAAAGYSVAFSYISESSRQKAEALESSCAGNIVALKCDSTTESGANSLLEAALASFGRVDVLINNAGTSLYKLIQDTEMCDYNRVINNSLTAAFVHCKMFAPHFIERKNGRIINISSVWGVCGGAMESAYSAAKAGMIGLTKSLAKELAPSGITVNALAPGAILTDMLSGFSPDELSALTNEIPLGRLGTPQDIAAAALFLAGKDADYITGQVLSIDGGM